MTATVVIPVQRAPEPDPAERWQLVTAAQSGDRQEFGQLYRLYQPTVFRVIYRRVQNPTLAEDLTQDVFLRALRSIGSVSWQGRDISAWLVTIARNIAIDHFKSGRFRLEVTVGDVLDGETRVDRSPEGDPAGTVAAHDINLTLLAAVKRLNAEQQECIILRFFHRYSLAETARVMGKNAAAVKQMQHRAVRALARLLDGSGVAR